MSLENNLKRIADALESIAESLSKPLVEVQVEAEVEVEEETPKKPKPKKQEKKSDPAKSEDSKPKSTGKKLKTTKPATKVEKTEEKQGYTDDDVREVFSQLVKVDPKGPKTILRDLGVESLSKLDSGDYEEAIEMAEKRIELK